MMPKAPTAKSRMIANGGAGLIAVGLILDAWFSPPIPRVSILLFGFVAVAIMQWAKQTREADGVVIPDSVMKSGVAIANTEISLALIDALCVMIVLGMEISDVAKSYEQIATGVALAMFAITFFVFRITRSRFDALMQVAVVNLPAN